MVVVKIAASRAKMVAMKGVSKLRGGQHGTLMYPQPEGQLGDCMTRHGHDLGDKFLLGKQVGNNLPAVLDTAGLYIQPFQSC